MLGTGRPVTDAAAADGRGAAAADGLPASGRPGRYGRPGARRPGFGRAVLPSRGGPPTVSGRWSLLPPSERGERDEAGRTRRLHALAGALLDRHGILIRGAVAAERVTGGFGALYPVLRAMEEAGQCRRGYFVEGLGAAQFALPGAVDRMRAMAGPAPPPARPWCWRRPIPRTPTARRCPGRPGRTRLRAGTGRAARQARS